MDKSEDGTDGTPKPGPEERKYFCKICSLDYSTESQFSEHKWSSLHHNQMEKSYGRGFSHRCLLCLFESHSIGEYSKHIFGDQHKDAFSKYKAKAKAARLAKQRAADLAAKQAAKWKASLKVHSHWRHRPPNQRLVSSHARFRNAHHRQMEWSGHYNPQIGNHFTRQNESYNPFNQPMFRTQLANQWQEGYRGNNYCYDHRDNQQWQYNGNTKWMNDRSGYNSQGPNSGQHFFVRPPRFTAPLGSNSIQKSVVSRPIFTAPQGSTISPKNNTVTTLSAKHDNSINDKNSTSFEKGSPEATSSAKAKSNAINSMNHKDSTSSEKGSLEATSLAKAKSNVVISANHKDSARSEKGSPEATSSAKAKSNKIHSTNHRDSARSEKGSPEATSSAKAKSNKIHSTNHRDSASSEEGSLEAKSSAKAKSNAIISTNHRDSASSEKAPPKPTLSAKAKPNAIDSKNRKHSTILQKATTKANLSAEVKSSAVNSANHKDSRSSEKAGPEAPTLKKIACETKISTNTKVFPISISKVTAKSDTTFSTKENKCKMILKSASTTPSLSEKTQSNVSYSDIDIKNNTILLKPTFQSAISKNMKSTEESKYKSVCQKDTQNDTKSFESSDTGFFSKAITNSLTKKHEMHSRKNVEKPDGSVSEGCIFRNSVAIGSCDNSKPDDIQEKQKLVTNTLVSKVVPNKDRSVNDVSCHLSSDLTKHSTDDINARINTDSETSRESPLRDILKKDLETRKELTLSDALVKHISKSLKPNVGASRSRLHAGTRTQIENTETTLQHKLVQVLRLSKSKHTQETEIAKLKQISGPQKRFRKRYGLQLGSSDGPTDDIQENSENRLLKNLSDCNFTDMKIHEDPELMSQLRAFANIGEQSSFSDDLSAIDINSGRTKTPCTSRTTDVSIKQEPIEPLEDVVQKVAIQVFEPTNISENLSTSMKEKYKRISENDKQKQTNSLPVDLKQCYQQDQLPIVSDDLPFVDINSGKTGTPPTSITTGINIKQEPIEPLEDVVRGVTKQVHELTNISENLSSSMKEKSKIISKTDKQKKSNNLPIHRKQCYQHDQLLDVSEDLPFVDINSGKTGTPSTTIRTGISIKQEPIEPLEDVVLEVTKQVYEPTIISKNLSSCMKENCKRVSKTDKQKKTTSLLLDSKQCYQQNQLSVVNEDLPFVDINSGKTSAPSSSSTATSVCIKQEPTEGLQVDARNVTLQVNESSNFSENLSSCMKEKCRRKICEEKKSNSLSTDPRQFYQHNQMPDISEDLPFVDVSSVKTAKPSTSSTTDEAISDKQKKPHTFGIDSKHSQQQNQVSLVTGIHIKNESLAYSKAASVDNNTFLEPSSELDVQTDAAIKTKNVSTTEFKILQENMYQQTHNTLSTEKSDLIEWKNRNNSSGIKAQQNRKIIANRKAENGQSTKIDANSKYSCKVQLERLDMSSVKVGVTAIQEDSQLAAVSKKKEKTKDGITKRKTNTHKEVVPLHSTSDLSLVRCSQSSPAPVEVGSSGTAKKLETMDQTSAKCSKISPKTAQRIHSSIEASTSGIQSDLERLFNISVREESLHQKVKEMEKNIQELKEVILKKQMDLNNVQSAKQQLDIELQSLRGMRMNILEGARGRGEDLSSLPEIEKVSNRKRQHTSDVFRNSVSLDEPHIVKEDAIDGDNEVSTTIQESQAKKPCSTRVEQKKDNPKSQVVKTDTSYSDADTTTYPPAIVLSTGNQNIDMQSVISVLSNPHILQQIQHNFNKLNQMPTEPEKDALIVTIPETGSVPDASSEDCAMEEDPAEKKVPDKEALIVNVPESGILQHFPPDNHEDYLEEKETRKLRKKRKLPSGDEDNVEKPMTRNSKRVKTMRESKILAKKTLMEAPECQTESTSKKKSCAVAPKGHTLLSKEPSETQVKQTLKRVGKRKSGNLPGKDSEETLSEESLDKQPGTSKTSKQKSCDTRTPVIDPKEHTHASKKPSEKQAKQTLKGVGEKKSGILPLKNSEEEFSEESSDKDPGTSRKLRVKPSPIEYPAKKRSSKLSKKQAENSAQLDTKETPKKLSKKSKKKERSSPKKDSKKLCKNTNKESQAQEMMDESNLRFINCDDQLLKMEIMEDNLYCVCGNNTVKAYSLQFGSLINDLTLTSMVTKQECRRVERLSKKLAKDDGDINLLKNCKTFGSCQLKGTYTAIDADILSIAFVKKTLFVSYANQKLCEFDLETQECIYEYHCSSNVKCMHSNWDTLYIGMLNGIIAAVNSKKRELITKHTLNEDFPPVYITSMVRGAAKVLIVAHRIISIIDEKTGSWLAELYTQVKADVIYMNVIGEKLYTADERGFLFVNNVNNFEKFCTCLDSSLTSFQITDQYIITASEKRSVFKFVDKKKYKAHLQYAVSGKPLRCALVHQKTLILGGRHGLVCLYDPWDHFWSKEYSFYPKRLKAYGRVKNAEKKRQFVLQTLQGH